MAWVAQLTVGLLVRKLLLSRPSYGTIKVRRGIRSRRKHAVDYCLLDDYNFENSESISWYSRHATLRRSDIMTMLPEVVMSPVVIESWAVLLNHLESAEHLLPRMAFFGIRHMECIMQLMDIREAGSQSNDITDRLYHIWDTFIQDCDKTFNLNAEFIFVPVNIGGHFACVCINFGQQTVDLLDYQHHANWDQSEMCNVTRQVASAVSDYLDVRTDRGYEITSFEHRQIPFRRQTPLPNITESGVFCMMYMLMYEGLPFEHPDLERKRNRRYLVVELVATLVLADINVNRDIFEAKLNGFIAGKEDLWAKLQKKRKIKAVLSKK
ncbi:uncharacterized protein LOC141590906 [Silene latifolia]|uniref:uncharacterized protein LOC141590906 n=1 Tax=Silene latifolia TaxID=37657 RepID=UPI003D77BA4E